MVILQLEEQPAIIQAIFAGGEAKEITDLIKFKQDVNCLDSDNRTPLHAGAFKGDASIVSILLSNGAKVNAKDSKWITPLHRACSVDSSETVSILLKHKADVNARDRSWQTPLHVAAANGAFKCVELLLPLVQNPNVTDRSGRTALHHACYNGHTDTVDLLIQKGCMVNAYDEDCRPIHCAVQMGHFDTVQLLLYHNADVNVKDRNQYTPLHVAAAGGSLSLARLLLGHPTIEVNVQNAYGNTPLHIACLNGHNLVCQELILSGADIEMCNYRGQTPLHIAAVSTYGVDCMSFLLAHKAFINAQSLDGRTPLHMTAIHGRFTRSKMLIDRGAVIDSQDKNGCTPLHIAARYGHDLLANTLLGCGADPVKRGYEGRTPLHMCCLAGYVECCRKLLQAKVDLNAVDDNGMTPTHCAAYKGSPECLDLLVSNGANFQIADNLGRLPLHYAATQGHYECVFTLVGIGSPTNAQDNDGCTPLHLASGYDLSAKSVEYLLAHKSNASLRDKRGFLALHYALAGGNVAAVGFLLNDSGATEWMQKQTPDITPLHLAAKLGNVHVMRAILAHYTDVNLKSKQLQLTPLHLACREGHVQCVQLLVRFGALPALQDSNGMTAVHYSSKNGHARCLPHILHYKAKYINFQDRLERTALMLAISAKQTECVQLLTKSGGADPNVADRDLHTAYFRAVASGHKVLIEILMFTAASHQTYDVHGKSVFLIAAAAGHLACLKHLNCYMLEKTKMHLDVQQCSALHWACYNAHVDCVDFLLSEKVFKKIEGNPFSPAHCAAYCGSSGSLELVLNKFKNSANLKDARARSPLHVACLHGHVACVKLLVEKGGELNAKDEDGRTPLIAAAQYGQVNVIEYLLGFEFKRATQDVMGNNALHWACYRKHSNVALMILEDLKRRTTGRSMINAKNSDGKTPLHLSSRNGLVEVTRELLKKGASTTIEDKEGLTPALCCAPNMNVAQCLHLILKKSRYKTAVEKTVSTDKITEYTNDNESTDEGSDSDENIIR